MEIGEKIRQIRIHKGLTQTDLVKGICSTTYLSKIESGKTKPSYSFLIKVSHKLEVDPDFLMNKNQQTVEPDVHRIFLNYLKKNTIHHQDLALLTLHAKENHPYDTLLKIYFLLISYYTKHNIESAHAIVQQAANIIPTDSTLATNEQSYYFKALSQYYFNNHNYSNAFLYANLHLNVVQTEETPLKKGKAYYNLSLIRKNIDEDLELSRIYAKKALEIFKAENYKSGIGLALIQLAIQYHRNEQYDKSLETLDELAQFSQENKPEYYAPILEYNYGRVHQKLKQFDRAIPHYFKSIEIDKNAGKEEQTIHALKGLAEIYLELKNWEELDKYLSKAFNLTKIYHHPYVHIELLHIKAQIFKVRYDFPAYEKALQQTIQQAIEQQYPLLIKKISTELADHYYEMRAYKMAAKYYKSALNE